ncbi:MAG TPA: hypothetical protein DDY82_05010 [Clostridiales bacterium]|nr:hypothetical protein [Clostridiales bacterium]
MAVIFCGEKTHQIDEKNRIRIPSCFKSDLGAGYVFGKGPNGVIDVLPKETVEKRLSSLQEKLGGEFCDEEIQELLYNYASNFTIASEDSQGRVVLPEDLRTYACINKDVVTIGAIDHLVLMSAEKRKEQQSKQSYSDTLKLLKDKLSVKKDGI